MPVSQKKAKDPITIEITKNELNNILEQFQPDMLRDDERIFKYKKAMQSLEKSDQIIFSLYAEMESERKVAELLGVSRSPIHKILTKIKQQILTETNDNND